MNFNPNQALASEILTEDIYNIFEIIGKNFFEIDRVGLKQKNYGVNLLNIFSQSDNIKHSLRSRGTRNLAHNYFSDCNCHNSIFATGNFFNERERSIAINSLNNSSIATFNSSKTIEALVYPEAYRWNSNQITYSFYEDSIFQGNYYNFETGVKEVSQPIKNNVRAILDWLETFVALEFVEVAETPNNFGTLRYMLSNEPDYAYGYIPTDLHPADGDVHLSAVFDNSATTDGFQSGLGSHGFMTLIHETLHALGLKHPGNYDGDRSGTGVFLDYGRDNTTNTLMSYNFTTSSAATPMPYDILALQSLYGANNNYHQEDTVYLFETVDNYGLGIQNFSSVPQASQKLKSAIWDTGGVDTLDLSALTAIPNGYHLDLREGGIITTADSYNNYSYNAIGDSSQTLYQTTDFGTKIAYGVRIENAIGSSNNDNIIGNAAVNLIEAGKGNDTIEGKGGLDIFAYRPLDSIGDGLDTLIDFELGETLRVYHDGLDLTVESAVFNQDSQELNLDLRFVGSDRNYSSQINLALPNLDSNLLIYDFQASEKLNFDANFISTNNADENYIDFTFQPRTSLSIGEFGRVTAFDHNGQTIELQNTYINPVVFALPLSRQGDDPAIVRLTDIQSDSFQAYLQEPEYRDGKHTQEEFSYLVLEAGNWQLEDGTLLEVKTVESDRLTGSSWQELNFDLEFDTNPVVLSQVQTKQGRHFVRTRQQDVTRDGFKLAMEESEALNTSGHLSERIGWLAIEPGQGNWGSSKYQAGHTEPLIDHRGYDLEFGREFENVPHVFASIASFYDDDPAGLRYQNLSSTQVGLVIEEDRSLDLETTRTAAESVDFLAISGSGSLTATAI